MSISYDGPSPPTIVSGGIFFTELLKKPGTVVLSLRGTADRENPERIVHNILDDDNFKQYKLVIIPALNICVEIYSTEEVKKILYWLEQQSYSSRKVETEVVDHRAAARGFCLVNAYFDLQDNFFSDIPDGVDGFKDI